MCAQGEGETRGVVSHQDGSWDLKLPMMSGRRKVCSSRDKPHRSPSEGTAGACSRFTGMCNRHPSDPKTLSVVNPSPARCTHAANPKQPLLCFSSLYSCVFRVFPSKAITGWVGLLRLAPSPRLSPGAACVCAPVLFRDSFVPRSCCLSSFS